MLILGGSVGFLLLCLVLAVLTLPRRMIYPRKYVLVETPLDGLKDAEIATIGDWSRDLEELGFRRAGEYSIRLDHGGGAGNLLQIEKFRAWLSPDGRPEPGVGHRGTDPFPPALPPFLVLRGDAGAGLSRDPGRIPRMGSGARVRGRRSATRVASGGWPHPSPSNPHSGGRGVSCSLADFWRVPRFRS